VSMRGCYRRVTQRELAALLKNPEGIFTFLYPEDPATVPESRFLDIDKSWEAIQFLLTGDLFGDHRNPPLSDAVLGGTWLGNVDVGYGPSRYLTPAEVKAVATALHAIPEAEFRRRFNRESFATAGVTTQWENDQDAFDYLLPHYAALQAIFSLASQENDGMILWIG
jgi:hypothetical protein